MDFSNGGGDYLIDDVSHLRPKAMRPLRAAELRPMFDASRRLLLLGAPAQAGQQDSFWDGSASGAIGDDTAPGHAQSLGGLGIGQSMTQHPGLEATPIAAILFGGQSVERGRGYR